MQSHRRASRRPFRPIVPTKAVGFGVLDLTRVKPFAVRVAMMPGDGGGVRLR